MFEEELNDFRVKEISVKSIDNSIRRVIQNRERKRENVECHRRVVGIGSNKIST